MWNDDAKITAYQSVEKRGHLEERFWKLIFPRALAQPRPAQLLKVSNAAPGAAAAGPTGASSNLTFH